MRLSLVLAALVAGLVALGASAAAGGGCAPKDSVHTRGSGTSVEIAGCKFAPVVLVAPVGATVTWTNTESYPPHNIHGLGWGMTSSALLGAGSKTQHTFDASGLYPYQCTLHLGMSGVIVVSDGPVTDTAPRESALVAGRTTQREDSYPLLAGLAAAALALTAAGAYRVGRGRARA